MQGAAAAEPAPAAPAPLGAVAMPAASPPAVAAPGAPAESSPRSMSPRSMPGDADGAAPLFDLSAELADQASVNTLQNSNRVLQMLGLRSLFDRAVQQPKDEIKNIAMQVPLSMSFLKKQHAAGAAPRKTNAVFTAKYSIWSFVPIASLYQFRRFTNAFYLGIAVIAIVGFYGNNLWVVSYDPITIIILLAVVVGVALLFEGKDDWARHSNDRATNLHKTQRVRNGKLEQTTWGDLIPGDLIFVDDRESAPADFVLLASFGADKNGSLCYIETSSIDGETNLKIKEAPEYLTHLLSEGAGAAQKGVPRSASMRLRREASSRLQLDTKKEQLARVITPMVAGLYEFEQPNAFLQFNGAFTPVKQPGTKHGIFFKNFILRGSQVRNTKYVLGMVVYSGPETKLALSKKKAPAKLSQIDKFMNRILLFVFVLYLILTVLADLVLVLAVPDTGTWWYFTYTSSVNSFNVPGWLAFFFTFLVLFANIIPIPVSQVQSRAEPRRAGPSRAAESVGHARQKDGIRARGSCAGACGCSLRSLCFESVFL
jgi:magnesium-transporting ATPase (P-type)